MCKGASREGNKYLVVLPNVLWASLLPFIRTEWAYTSSLEDFFPSGYDRRALAHRIMSTVSSPSIVLSVSNFSFCERLT